MVTACVWNQKKFSPHNSPEMSGPLGQLPNGRRTFDPIKLAIGIGKSTAVKAFYPGRRRIKLNYAIFIDIDRIAIGDSN